MTDHQNSSAESVDLAEIADEMALNRRIGADDRFSLDEREQMEAAIRRAITGTLASNPGAVAEPSTEPTVHGGWRDRPNRGLDSPDLGHLRDVAQSVGMREALVSAQRIIERDFPNGQLAIDIRNALAQPSPVGSHGDGYCGCTERCRDRDNCQYDVKPASQPSPAATVEKIGRIDREGGWNAGRDIGHEHSSAGNADATCYLDLSAVRAILIEQDDDHREVMEAVLQDIDALPTVTSTEPQAVTEQLRSSGRAEQNGGSSTWTAGIDALRQYPYQDEQWHLHAIEFHHKVREEAEGLRDRWFALALSRPHQP